MNVIIFSVCWTLWICWCFLAAISFFHIESKPSRVLCRKEGKKYPQRKVVRQRRSQSPDQWIWWRWNQDLFHWCHAKAVCRATSSQEKSDSENPGILKVEKDSVRIGIWKQMANTSPYPAEQSQVWRPQSTQEQRRRFLETRRKEWKLTLDMRQETGAECWQTKMKEILVPWGPNAPLFGERLPVLAEEAGTHGFINHRIGWSKDETYWYGDYLCHLQWKQLFILDKITQRTTGCSWTYMWKRSSTSSALFRDSCSKILTKSLMWKSLTAMTHRGQKSKYLFHRWSSGQKQVRVFSTPSYVWEKFLNQQKQWRDGKHSWWDFSQKFLNNITESMESPLSSSGIFRKIHVIGIT